MASIKSILITTLAALTTASPLAIRQTNSTTTTSTTLTPSTLSLWDPSAAKVTYNVPSGVIQRGAGKHDTSTLFTFSIPSAYRANTCSLSFTLTNPSSYTHGSSNKLQLFSTQQGAYPGATSDFRNNQLATLAVYNGASGVWGTVDGTSTGQTALTVPCAGLVDRPYLELAPQGDNVDVFFAAGDGLKITVL